MSPADVITVASLLLALAGVVVAVIALQGDDKNRELLELSVNEIESLRKLTTESLDAASKKTAIEKEKADHQKLEDKVAELAAESVKLGLKQFFKRKKADAPPVGAEA